MRIVEPSYRILKIDGIDLRGIEESARLCYQSGNKITDDGESAKKITKALCESGHEAMIEFADMKVRFICDRGVSHELVRHRCCSFAQESTRYCNYSKGKYGSEITVIRPYWTSGYTDEAFVSWFTACQESEKAYINLLDAGWTPQQARAVLPNSLKTEIDVKANFREWRHIFELRCARDAHPQIRQLMVPLWREVKSLVPIVFDDCYDPPEDPEPFDKLDEE